MACCFRKHSFMATKQNKITPLLSQLRRVVCSLWNSYSKGFGNKGISSFPKVVIFFSNARVSEFALYSLFSGSTRTKQIFCPMWEPLGVVFWSVGIVRNKGLRSDEDEGEASHPPPPNLLLLKKELSGQASFVSCSLAWLFVEFWQVVSHGR